ncbi:esterase FE4-like [Bicyclus anynana]|uniref:Carboxylic ester hydrolase n=1 Tax=Bicyclus anynana TaxID=110368 RepID=A0A6J1NBG6_BICAN|nr:esterase FE4-like [Bicyclus anynana]
MFRRDWFLYICGYFMLVTCQTPSKTVTIDQGPVKGYRSPKGDVFVFYGIPYATAPTGTQKFRPPLPPPSWTDTLEAVENNIICPQNLGLRNVIGDFKMQEDCLIANVYVPDTEERNLPVVVYVHGGAYQFGYGADVSPINMVNSKKIVAVNFNYRVGAHGLLCLGTKNVPGNAGMKDQVALLRWVQNNIAQFGGNPNEVTISGCSAGGSSVDLLMLSKATKGLFNRVVPESGSNTASFSVQVDPIANAKMIANELNVSVDDFDGLENFYKTAPYEMLYKINVGEQKDTSTVFAPCIERDIGEEMFLDDHPVNILKSGEYPKYPMLYGITDMEGLYRVNNFDTWKDEMNENFAVFLPEDLQFENEEVKQEVAQKIKQFYFGEEPVSEANILQYVQYFTDVMFGVGAAKNVELQVEAGNNQIYLYEYAFVDDSVDYVPYTNIRGARHCSQGRAVWDANDESKLSEEFRNMKSVMRELWLNFITTG